MIWRLVSRRWSFIVMNHRIVYWDDRQMRDPIWEANVNLRWFCFNFEVNFIILPLPQASNYFDQHCLFLLSSAAGDSRLHKYVVCILKILLQQLLANFYLGCFDSFYLSLPIRKYTNYLNKINMQTQAGKYVFVFCCCCYFVVVFLIIMIIFYLQLKLSTVNWNTCMFCWYV